MDNPLVDSKAAMSIVQGCLVIPVQADLYDDLLERIRGDVLNRLYSKTVNGVVFDMSAVSVMDTYVFRHLVDTGKMAHLLGVEAVLVGLQAGVVSALVDLEVDTTSVRSYRTIDEAVAYLTAGSPSFQNGEDADVPYDSMGPVTDESESASDE